MDIDTSASNICVKIAGEAVRREDRDESMPPFVGTRGVPDWFWVAGAGSNIDRGSRDQESLVRSIGTRFLSSRSLRNVGMAGESS